AVASSGGAWRRKADVRRQPAEPPGSGAGGQHDNRQRPGDPRLPASLNPLINQFMEATAMSAITTATLKVPGASLYYEVTGSGPVLLMIPGAPADAGTFAATAAALADRYTVVTYDWRGSSRSPMDEPPGDLPDGMPMRLQGDDASDLLAAVGAGPAYVLGCSGGALAGLDLVARHPGGGAAWAAPGPPAMTLLPAAAGGRAALKGGHEPSRRDGPGPAMMQFIATAVRTGGPPSAGDEPGPPAQERSPAMPDMSQMPPEMAEGMARMQANSEFFLAYMLPATIGYVPDIAALVAGSPRLVLGAAEASGRPLP